MSLTPPQAPEIDSLQSLALQWPRPKRKAVLLSLLRSGQLDDDEALVALYDWRTFWAREEQVAPDWEWFVWLLLAGRGFGKTRTLAEWANEQAETRDPKDGPGHIVCRVKDDIEKVVVAGPAGILTCAKPWFRPKWEKGILTWPNGAQALTFSAQEPNQLRGPQCAWAACDEVAAWEYFEEAWSNLIFGLRLGQRPQVLAATTPRPLPQLRELVADKTTHVTRGRTRDNSENLASAALEAMERKYAGTRRGRQELDGEILDDVPGALWTRTMLEDARPGKAHPGRRPPRLDEFERIILAVDPSGSDGESGDWIGIVAAGKLNPQAAREYGREFVILADLTCQERPEEWARRVAEAYEVTNADRVVAEANFGGDMVRALIQTARPNIPVALVHASRGKHVRAEPISALYEQKRVLHAEAFPQCEDEMCMFTPTGYKGEDSPNRADALVWALTELAFGGVEPEFFIRAL
jgi:phage terminase large subunit-like protein